MCMYQELEIYLMKSSPGPWEICLQIVLRIVLLGSYCIALEPVVTYRISPVLV